MVRGCNDNNRLRERERERQQRPFAAPTVPVSCIGQNKDSTARQPPKRDTCPEPMQLGCFHLKPEERQCRIRDHCCLYCGKPGHFFASCTKHPSKLASSPVEGRIQSSQVSSQLAPRPRTQVYVSLFWKRQSIQLSALIDSGADESFIDAALASQLDLPTVGLDQPLRASALDGRLLANVTHRTVPVHILLSGNHQEELSLHGCSIHLVMHFLGHIISDST